MSKAALNRFMEKAASNPVLAGKLEALEQQHLMQIVSLAQERGIDLVPEDFVESAIPLNDEQTEAAAGAGNCGGPCGGNPPGNRGSREAGKAGGRRLHGAGHHRRVSAQLCALCADDVRIL